MLQTRQSKLMRVRGLHYFIWAVKQLKEGREGDFGDNFEMSRIEI